MLRVVYLVTRAGQLKIKIVTLAGCNLEFEVEVVTGIQEIWAAIPNDRSFKDQITDGYIHANTAKFYACKVINRMPSLCPILGRLTCNLRNGLALIVNLLYVGMLCVGLGFLPALSKTNKCGGTVSNVL